MSALFDALKVKPSEDIDENFFNRRFQTIDDTVSPLVERSRTEDSAFQEIKDDVLSLSEQAIASLRDRLVAITQLEWLTASSSTPVILALGANVRFIVSDVDLGLFAPGPFAVVTRAANATDYAVVRTIAFDRSTGAFDVQIEATGGAPGPFTDWELAAVAGSTVAQMALLAQGTTARNSAVAAAAATAADRVQTDADALSTAADRVAVHADRQAADASATAADTSAKAAQAAANSATGLRYAGVWNAATNIPALASSAGNLGALYKVSVAGTTALDGHAMWNVGDLLLFDGGKWDKIEGQDGDVVSVAGLTGSITIAALKAAIGLTADEAAIAALQATPGALLKSWFYRS